MGAESPLGREQLPSGKKIIRSQRSADGSIVEEMHCYGGIDIAISFTLRNGIKFEETYMVKNRIVSRRSYEKARANYPDMPAPDSLMEDWGKGLLGEIRAQQKRKKAESEKRFTESQESRFPRPESTNWLRVMTKDKAHLVVFASRDWKILARETSIPTGRAWLDAFGFSGLSTGASGKKSTIAEGLEIGFEVPGDRTVMLETSKRLLNEVVKYVENPPEVSRWHDSIRPRPKPRKIKAIAWPDVLPPLIDFLSGLNEAQVKIYNHHQ